MGHTLEATLDAAACGHGVHAALAALECDGLAATMNPRFLAALLDRTGRTTDTIDLLAVAASPRRRVAASLPGDPPLELREIADPDHPCVRRPVGSEALPQPQQ
ncbi:hypothetical protein [Streptomyces sp. NBC_01296]|uniref:hypothetical protein n=1 Tax=Streptomyces sp. NBC_01296 TaxID=2903816 RepID=UPI003FA3911C